MSDSWRTGIRDELAALLRSGLERRLLPVTGPQGPLLGIAGRNFLSFAANDYLGLAAHPALVDAATAAIRREGFGAGSSRLLAGNLEAHRDLEVELARWKQTEAALVFNSGYHANMGVLASLAGPPDAIYSDRLNHASIIDGARLSRATVYPYPHGDDRALAALLEPAHSFRRRIIVSESLFSMQGDVAPLEALRTLSRLHDAILVVDDAHAVGVLGPEGSGLVRGAAADLHVGTFGKALGGFGAFVAGDRALIDLLVNRARTFIFTTALPVPVVAAARAALHVAAGPDGTLRRQRLAQRVALLGRRLRDLGLPWPEAPTHIHPLVVGEAQPTMALTEQLQQRGILVQGIRPPTVPTGTSRLRISLMASHTEEHIHRLADALTDLRHLLPA